MNKMFEFSTRLENLSDGYLEETKKIEENTDVRNKDSQLLDYIYALDPVTSLPCGDLAIYLGDRANPEIRYFIEMNLLQPLAPEAGSDMPDEVVNKFRTLSDDDIAFFSRSKIETREEYADRLKLYFVQEKQKRRQEGRLKEIEGLLKKSEDDR